MTWLFFPIVSYAQGAGGYALTGIDVMIEVQKDASIDVTETIEGEFFEPRHGIFRFIPFRYTHPDGTYKTISVRVDGVRLNGEVVSFEQYREGDFQVIKIGEDDMTVEGPFEYTLLYHVERAMLHHETTDELFWNVASDAWGVTLPPVTASVKLPELDIVNVDAECFTGPLGATDQNCTFTFDNDLLLFTANEAMTISVRFPKFIVAEPGWGQELSWWLKDNWDFILLLLPVLTLIGLCVFWYHKGRDAKGRGMIVAQYEPPDDLRPTETGTLVDGRVHPRDFSSAIVDLAVRGYLSIREEDGGVLSTRKYFLQKKKEPDDALKPFERELLQTIFGSENEVELSKRRKEMEKARKTVEKVVYNDMASLGYYLKNPNAVRTLYILIGIVIIFVGHVIGIAVVDFFDRPWALFAAYATGGFFFLFAPLMTQRSEKGALALEHAKGFKLYLETAEKYRIQWQEKKGIFEKFLPYAMVFGVADKWAKALATQAATQPTWYSGNFAAFSATDFSDRVTKFVNTSSAVAAPKSSGGGGGGGSSGGGFGGGGGGSW